MLDLKAIRQNTGAVRDGIAAKGGDTALLDRLLELDVRWRGHLQEVEQIKARRNQVSEEIGRRKRAGDDASALVAEMGQVSGRIKALDEAVKALDEEIQTLLLGLPNLPAPDVPVGEDESQNGASHAPSTSSPRPTGTWARAWASSTSNAPARSPVPASPSTRAPARAWSAP